MNLSPVHRSPNRLVGLIVEHQVPMPSPPVQPILDAILRLRNRGANHMLSGSAIGVSGGPGNLGFARQPLAQVLFGQAHVLPQDVPACAFILAQVPGRPAINATLFSSGRRYGRCGV